MAGRQIRSLAGAGWLPFSWSRRVWVLVVIPFLLFGLGTAGYMWLEGWSFSDAFFMTAITLTTVGYGEVRPLDDNGRLFTTLLILLGAFYLAFGLEYLLSASIGGDFRRRQLIREIGKLKDHVIVCGYGRVGASAANSLRETGQRPVLIIEKEEGRVQQALEAGFLVLTGDSTDDDTLRGAGIERAWGVLVCTGDDSLNLFVVLSARSLNKDLFIIARSTETNAAKMRLAGANRIVSPYQIGGRHMANIAVRPNVADFLDVVTLDGGRELWMEELVIAPDSVLVGQTLAEADIRKRLNVLLIAILRFATGSTVNPTGETRLEAGDEMIVLGTREQLAALVALAGGLARWGNG